VAVVAGELDAVETRQSGLGAHPHIAGAVLGQRGDAQLRQALFDRPVAGDVVLEALVRLQRVPGQGAGGQRAQQAAPQPVAAARVLVQSRNRLAHADVAFSPDPVNGSKVSG
jgi:hypothetical protein